MENTYYSYRAAANEQELTQLLKLRYNGYRNSRLKGFCPENDFGLDLDIYDCYANHFGLFQVCGDVENPVGYMRVIQEELSPMADWIKNIAGRCSRSMFEKIEEEREELFPLIEYFPGAKKVSTLNKYTKNRTDKLCEASRFTFDPSIRSFGLAKFVIESTIAINMFVGDFTESVISCSDLHYSIYKQYGYQKMEGTKTEIIEKHNSPDASLLLLLLLKQNLSGSIRLKFEKMAFAYQKCNAINFYPHNRNCFMPVREVQLEIEGGSKVSAA